MYVVFYITYNVDFPSMKIHGRQWFPTTDMFVQVETFTIGNYVATFWVAHHFCPSQLKHSIGFLFIKKNMSKKSNHVGWQITY